MSWPDLASRAFGATVASCTDEFFAAADNLLTPDAPRFTPATFGAKGQVYDGWETRRRREPGDDQVIVRLGVPGIVHSVVVDTAFFTGNHPSAATVDGCALGGYPGPAELAAADWFPLVPRAGLRGDARNVFDVSAGRRCTHVRLTIHPDGGVARLRVFGEALPDPLLLPEVFDLAAAEYGGRVTGCSDMFYGAPQQLLAPGLARVMGEGWETARRRDGGNDFVEVRLGLPGVIALAELDTSHFKGNAPGWARLSGRPTDAGPTDAGTGGARTGGARTGGVEAGGAHTGGGWTELLPRTALRPDTRHRFRLAPAAPVGEVRLDVYPDGGMARLRLIGRPDPGALAALTERIRRT